MNEKALIDEKARVNEKSLIKENAPEKRALFREEARLSGAGLFDDTIRCSVIPSDR